MTVLYYGLSLALMFCFPWITRAVHDTNLPPLKPWGRLWINLIFLNLGAAYFAMLRCRSNKPLPKLFWGFFLGLAIALCALPPVFSGDLYEYLIRGRILGVYHQNPYAHPSAEFSQDRFFSHSVWISTPENYGPVWVLVQWVMPTFFGQSVSWAVFMQKIMLLIFFALSGILFFRVAQKIYPEQSQRLTRAFVLNPNLWTHHVVDGHNDMVMIFWMLLGVYWLLQEKTFLSLFAAAMGMLVKFTSGILLLVLALSFLKSRSVLDWKAKIAFMFKALGLVFLVMVAAYAPFWIGKDTFRYFVTFKGWFYTNSVPYAVYRLLQRGGIPVTTAQVEKGFMCFFGANLVAALVCLWKKTPWTAQGFCRTVVWIFLALYTSYAIPFYGHHLNWSLPFLILSGFPCSSVVLTLFSMAGIFAYFKRLSFLYLLAWAVYLVILGVRRCLKK